MHGEFTHQNQLDSQGTSFVVFCGRVVFVIREGVNREKLTVKKIINNEMFFSPFMSLILARGDHPNS